MAVPFGNQAVSSQMLDHLGLVAGMYEQLGIGEELDALIPQDLDQRVVSVGQAVKAMVLNGLGFVNQTLYLTPQFYQTKPTERLIGAGIQPAHLNDDTLGRALDRLYEHDVTALFTRVSARACMRLGLTGGGSAHLDTTSFHLDGDYNQAQGAKEAYKCRFLGLMKKTAARQEGETRGCGRLTSISQVFLPEDRSCLTILNSITGLTKSPATFLSSANPWPRGWPCGALA